MEEIDTQPPQPPVPPRQGEWDQFTRQAVIVILLLGVLLLISLLRPFLDLLGVTLIFILILLYPINKVHTKTRLAYPIAVVVIFVPALALLFLFFRFVFQWGIESTQSMLALLGDNTEIKQGVNSLMAKIPGHNYTTTEVFRDLVSLIGRQLSGTLQLIIYTATAVFLAFLFIIEMPANLRHSFRSLSDVTQREFGILFSRLSTVWNGWLRSTVITSIIVGVTTALELYIFGIPYASILGVVSGLLNLIPTIGPLISYTLILLVTYTQGSSYLSLSPVALTILVLGVNVLTNQVIRLVIFPKLAGKAVHLPLFLIILGLVVAGFLWGVIGVILVVPLLGTVGEVLKYVLRKINRQDPYPDEEPQSGFWTEGINSQQTSTRSTEGTS